MKWLTLFMVLCSFSLQAETKILLFAGSTRKESINKKLIVETARLAKELPVSVTVIDLKNYSLPFYDSDLEASDGVPENVLKLRQLINDHSIIIIASPEYNASVTAVLKNTLDWLSLRHVKGSLTLGDKVFALMSASPSACGGSKGLIHLKEILQSLNATVLDRQVCLSKAYSAFNEEGRLINCDCIEQIKLLLNEAVNYSLKKCSLLKKENCSFFSKFLAPILSFENFVVGI